ncbi:hypothetical protein BC629DRAFT_1583945 [Irpex lacteus]|nr:hypothetical protein BC629DRAFT_1583945 [Irpex lacteus]
MANTRRSTRLNPDNDANASGSEYHMSSPSMEVDEHAVPVEEEGEEEVKMVTTTSRGRKVVRKNYVESSATSHDEDEIDLLNKPEVDDADADADADQTQTQTLSESRTTRMNNLGRRHPPPTQLNGHSNGGRLRRKSSTKRAKAASRSSARRTRPSAKDEVDEAYVDEPDNSASGDESVEDAAGTSWADADAEGEPEETDDRPYALRQRNKVNYAIPPPIEEMSAPPPKPRSKGKNGPPGWSATGAQLDRWLGGAGDDSDSDYPTRTPRKGLSGGFGGTGGLFAGSAGAGGLLPADLAAGTPSHMGKVGEALNQNVTFDEVGGLDDHINALKEMTLLPLLYPEVFQRFNLTPPRGTLLARALAASCRSNGKGIAFFMRKGADCLSKWVGEAERQLRLLFEEAKNSQPSIIFFDEIDGLAPVRSSKQDQIHASIVSTLLALMDGMDGRGQFYFPLPNMDARERIVRIMTKKWAGWENEKGEENAKGLAKLTKGYGGADLRALCTEAALNAVQRRYPQIYKSQDRLLLQPETINVELRDFMISVKSYDCSFRSPLPDQLVPLLQEALDKIKAKRTALEEAEWEDEGEEGAMERDMETLRVHRPRVILHGYHVQTLDVANLMSDSTRTPEASIVQLFVEAKRHQPSVVYIPSLSAWSAAVSETARTTLRTMLDGLAPTDPVLLLATVDGSFTSLPRDVRAWFGPTKENRVVLSKPTLEQRDRFFEPLVKDILRPPNQFPDGIPRKKRVLEELPIAPPLEPRAPTAAELAMQQESDLRTITFLRYRLGPILTELKRKFKRFTKRAAEEYNYDFNAVEQASAPPVHQIDTVTTTVEVQSTANGVDHVVEVVDQEHTQVIDEPMNVVPDGVDGMNEAQIQLQVQVQPQLFDVDLERMHIDLYRDKYLTPEEFLNDIRKIVHNANVRVEEDPERLYRAQAMLTAAEVSCQDFDANFRMECERMAAREAKRREEYRKNKAASKAAEAEKEKQNAEANAPRRSTRNSGQPLEISITDPLKLERRLKRARSTEGTAEPSEEENGDSHTAKRSRVSSAEIQMDDVQPIAEHLPTPPERHHAVRFVDNVADKTEPSSPTPHANEPVAVFPTHEQAPDPPASNGGFDPSLLNPMTPPLPLGRIRTTFFPSSADQVQQPQPVEEPAPEPMVVIERTPTPLPDFVVDPDAVSQLKQELQGKTEALNVEELEQLRAMCLARVWKHRTLVHEFVEEVADDEMDAHTP